MLRRSKALFAALLLALALPAAAQTIAPSGGGGGTAASQNTGTSGHTIPFLDGANTWGSAAQTFPAGAAATPGVVVGAGQTGLYSTGAGNIGVSTGGASRFDYGITAASTLTFGGFDIQFAANTGYLKSATGTYIMPGGSGVLAFSANTVAVTGSTLDAGISRSAAGVIALGNGTYGDKSADLAHRNLISSGSHMVGSATPLTLSAGETGIAKITASGTAPGAAGGKLALVCGTNAGTAKLIAYAGTSTTPVTVIDNIGSGVTGC